MKLWLKWWGRLEMAEQPLCAVCHGFGDGGVFGQGRVGCVPRIYRNGTTVLPLRPQSFHLYDPSQLTGV